MLKVRNDSRRRGQDANDSISLSFEYKTHGANEAGRILRTTDSSGQGSVLMLKYDLLWSQKARVKDAGFVL
jgi:hypothetical protein